MAAQVVNEPTGKKIGTTTMGATAGTGLAGAAAVVLVWILTEVGVGVPAEVSAALAVLIGGIGTLVGGKLAPSNQVRTEVQVVPVVEGTSDEKAAAAAATATTVPDGTGEHRADTAGSTAVDVTDPDRVVTETTIEVP
ncbi:hypothetical protein [Kocuria rhizophila]|uniref:hypothetical protein n=1 Tax=Kocuria rhizophila TaxID=72000 RepID=UPI0021A66AD7|nr:hypothetical protein [Kocuria rhizophila]MCT2249359.1 hypothetical protein [Kocuria rhizophila]